MKKSRDGFTLVEMLIAMVVTSIVLLALLMILSYSVRSANVTEARAGIQDASKDAMNHICTHIQEADHVSWDAAKKLLIVQEDEYKVVAGKKKLVKKEKYYYYVGNGNLYFKNVTSGDTSLTLDNRYLLTANVGDFEVKPDDVDDRVIHIKLGMKNKLASYDCNQDAHIRNKCKGGH